LHLYATLKTAQKHEVSQGESEQKIYPHDITKECHQQKQGDIYDEMHISGNSGNLDVGMPFSAYERDTSCRLEINKEKDGHPAQLHTSLERNHKGCH
jgi:hypothetical protein